MIAAAAGVPALVLLVMLCMKVAHDREASSEVRVEVTRIEKEMTGYRSQRRGLEEFFNEPATRSVTQRAAFLNALIDERSFPWTQFFLDLERHLPGGVRILTLSPGLVGDRLEVKMRVGALSDQSKLEFLKGLEEAPEFSDIEVVSEVRPGKGENLDVVEMDLSVDYRATPAGKKVRETGSGQ